MADALPRLADDPQLPGDPARADAYVRRALWRDALDELRRRYGRELERPAPLSLERMWERPQSEDDADAELAARQHREHVQAATARMLERLTATEAKLLRLRFLDEAPPDAIADELGVSRAQYYRRLSEASQHALDALVETYSGPACPHVRRLIRTRPEGLLGREDAGRRDAHLDECVHCRAFSLRARGALELLPLPAVGLLDRVGLRLGGLFGRGGDSIAAVRDGSELAAGGGVVAGAGTALTAGLGAKVAVGCTGAAVAVLCAGPLGVVPKEERAPDQAGGGGQARARQARAAGGRDGGGDERADGDGRPDQHRHADRQPADHAETERDQAARAPRASSGRSRACRPSRGRRWRSPAARGANSRRRRLHHPCRNQPPSPQRPRRPASRGSSRHETCAHPRRARRDGGGAE